MSTPSLRIAQLIAAMDYMEEAYDNIPDDEKPAVPTTVGILRLIAEGYMTFDALTRQFKLLKEYP